MLQDHSESRLHIAVVNYLNGNVRSGKSSIKVQAPFPGLLFLHPVNEFKDKNEAYWGVMKGILPGAADLLFFWSTTISGFNFPHQGAIELKTGSGLSPNQIKFRDKFTATGGHYAVCKTVASVRDTLVSWGLECKNAQAVEPRPSQKQQMAFYNEMCRNDYD